MFARARRVIACLVLLIYCITFTANAGVGVGADPNAKIIIEGVKETLQTSHTEKSESVMWQSMSGNGSTVETMQLAQINAKTKFSAPGGIDVQLPAGGPLKTQVQALSQALRC